MTSVARNVATEALAWLDNLVRLDVWQNLTTGLGTQRDKRMSGTFMPTAPLTYGQASNLYRGDALARRICDLPAKEMTREWVRFPADRTGKFARQCIELGVRQHFFDGMRWGRAFGGAVTIIGAQDGREMSQPINRRRLRSIKFLSTLDYSTVYPIEAYTNPFGEKVGKPSKYRIAVGGYIQEVHEERILRWDGLPLPPEPGYALATPWSDSVLTPIVEGIRDFHAANHSASVLVSDFAQSVFKIKGLAAMLASNKDGNVIRRLQLLDYCRSVLRAIPIDADKEEFERKGTPTSGLPDLLDRSGVYVSCLSGIPYTLLLGESAAGLNATGEGDHRNYHNQIRSEQETDLRPRAQYMFDLIADCSDYRLKSASVDGHVPFEFNRLWQPSEKETSETRLNVMKADEIAYTMGAVSPREVSSHWAGGIYSLDLALDPTVERANVAQAAPTAPPGSAPVAPSGTA